MNDEEKSSIYKKGLSLILENKFEESQNMLLVEYKNNPGEISLVHLLIANHVILKKNDELVKLLRYEEEVSLFRAKLGFIRNLLTKIHNLSLYDIGSNLLKRGWESDANIYFRIHSILTPDHDKSLIPLGENAIKNGQFQKGISLFSKAAENYFSKKEERLCYE